MYPPNGKCGDSEETDLDKLHDLKITLEQYQVYRWEQIDEFVEAFLNGADQSNLDPRLDTCVEKYKKLDEDRQVDFKSSAKAFTRLWATGPQQRCTNMARKKGEQQLKKQGCHRAW